MMAPACQFCGREPAELHHLTGRPAPGASYLDPQLVFPLCRRHHAQTHELLRRSRTDFLPAGPEQLPGRVLRVAELLARVADAERELALSPRSAIGLARLLLDTADGLAIAEPRREAVS